MIQQLKHLSLMIVSLMVVGITSGDLSAMNFSGEAANSDSVRILKLLQDRDQQIKELVGPKGTEYKQEQRDKLKDIINGVIDYRSMAAYALQNTYDTLSATQKDEFIDVFSTIVRDQSLKNLNIYRANIEYKKIEVVEDSAWVETLSQLEDVNTPVYYVMEEKEDNWKVVDFYVDNVSTAKSYRRSFQNVLRKRGFDYLLKTLRKRAESN